MPTTLFVSSDHTQLNVDRKLIFVQENGDFVVDASYEKVLQGLQVFSVTLSSCSLLFFDFIIFASPPPPPPLVNSLSRLLPLKLARLSSTPSSNGVRKV